MPVATRYGKEPEPFTSSSVQWSQQCRHFEYSEILLATENFDESLVIGQGGFGKVYMGTIFNGSTTNVAAIKRLDPYSSQGAPEFWAEVEMLSKFRHCNLVSLFGYCNHEKEMILVYEYMPNGTLEDHLHKFGTPLSWIQRLKICIGAARGLHYLHTGTGIEVGVIHRDVKTSNILLHESWAAKISDFGLSKIGRTNRPSTGVNTVVKGTFGYLDPDYYSTGKPTRKSDVYAFGVVLLEVLCRKRAVFDIDEQAFNLAIWAEESIKEGNLKKIIDPDLRGQISSKCLKEFVRIVERCLHMYPKQRPTMAEIAVSLESVTVLQQKFNNSMETSGRTTIFGRMVVMFAFPSKGENSGVPSSSSHPDANELETCIAQSQAPTNRLHVSGYENENHDDIEQPLPTIEDLQILGDAFPGHEIQASGYSRNGTTHCGFEWVRHLPDGSVNYIEGAKQPKYTVTVDDVDTYLSVEVQPLDDKQRKGELVQCFANDNKKITCHPDMLRVLENILKVGHTSFKLLVWIVSSETWEPAILEIKTSSFNIKYEGPNNGVVVDNKYTQCTVICLPAEIPSEFSILTPSDVEIFLRTDNSTDMSCSRDTIVLTMRLFLKRAVDWKLGKKKRMAKTIPNA